MGRKSKKPIRSSTTGKQPKDKNDRLGYQKYMDDQHVTETSDGSQLPGLALTISPSEFGTSDEKYDSKGAIEGTASGVEKEKRPASGNGNEISVKNRGPSRGEKNWKDILLIIGTIVTILGFGFGLSFKFSDISQVIGNHSARLESIERDTNRVERQAEKQIEAIKVEIGKLDEKLGVRIDRLEEKVDKNFITQSKRY